MNEMEREREKWAKEMVSHCVWGGEGEGRR